MTIVLNCSYYWLSYRDKDITPMGKERKPDLQEKHPQQYLGTMAGFSQEYIGWFLLNASDAIRQHVIRQQTESLEAK